MSFDRVGRGLRVEPEQKHLLLVDRFPTLAWIGSSDRRPARAEGEGALARQRTAGGSAQVLSQRKRAAQARRQIRVEVIDPIAWIDPASLPGGGTLHVERI